MMCGVRELFAKHVPAGKCWGILTDNQTAPSEPGKYTLYKSQVNWQMPVYEWIKEPDDADT